MTVPAYETLRTTIGRRLADTATHTFWTADELDDWLNDAQRDYAERTRLLRRQSVISARANLETYNFPDDYLALLRFEAEDGSVLDVTTAQNLEDQYGADWRTETGTPTHIYSDLDGEGKFRFYPRPASAVDATPTQFLPHSAIEINSPIQGNIFGVCAYGRNIYTLDATYISAYDGEISARTLVRRYTHGIVLGGAGLMVYVPAPADPTHLAEACIFWTQGQEIYKTLLVTGTTTHHFSSTGVVSHLVGIDGAYRAQYLYYVNAAGLVSIETGVIVGETVLSGGLAVNQSCGYGSAAATATWYFDLACGASGYYRITDAPGGVTVALVSATNTQGIATHGGTIYKITSAGALSDDAGTSIATGLAATARLFADANYIYVTNGSGTAVRVALADYATVDIAMSTGGAAYPVCSASNTWLVLGILITLVAGGNRIWTVDPDLGSVVDWGDATCPTDEGMAVDVVDTETIIVVNGEQGIVTQVFEDADAYRAFYVRYPATDALEVLDTRALVHYVLWQAYMRDGDTQDLQKAQLNYGMYLKAVGVKHTAVDSGFLRGRPTRPRTFNC